MLTDYAFVLHRYPYRETSFIAELLTQHQGRISVVCKGAQRPKSPLKGLLQAFTPLVIHAQGQRCLKTLTLAEAVGPPIHLVYTELISGLYMNELLMRLLPKEESCETLFAVYRAGLLDMSERSLRIFEHQLLKTLGYALPLQHIDPCQAYLFITEHGFEPCLVNMQGRPNYFLGQHLCAIARADYGEMSTLVAAKRLMRLAFQPLLGNKPLRSRELFFIVSTK